MEAFKRVRRSSRALQGAREAVPELHVEASADVLPANFGSDVRAPKILLKL